MPSNPFDDNWLYLIKDPQVLEMFKQGLAPTEVKAQTQIDTTKHQINEGKLEAPP